MVNNAGIAAEGRTPKPIWDFDQTVLETDMAVNVTGVFLGCKYAARQMMKQDPLASHLRLSCWPQYISLILSLIYIEAGDTSSLATYIAKRIRIPLMKSRYSGGLNLFSISILSLPVPRNHRHTLGYSSSVMDSKGPQK